METSKSNFALSDWCRWSSVKDLVYLDTFLFFGCILRRIMLGLWQKYTSFNNAEVCVHLQLGKCVLSAGCQSIFGPWCDTLTVIVTIISGSSFPGFMFTFDHVFSNNKKTTIALFRLWGPELLRKQFVFKFYNRAASGAMKLVLTEYLTKVLKLSSLPKNY